MAQKKLCLFPYIGGKHKLASKLIPLFPEHYTYVEPFAGAGNVLFQKPPSKVEVLNDINSDIVNLFRVLRDDFEKFEHFVKYTPFSRETFTDAKKQLETETDLFLRSSYWFITANQAFGGSAEKPTWATSPLRCKAKPLKNRVDNLHFFASRLRDCIIENESYPYIFEMYDRHSTFFYCDPPYLPETRKEGGYTHEMTYADHEALVECLTSITGKVMLSGYPNDLYDSLGWHRQDFNVTCSLAGRTRASTLQGKGAATEQQPRTESIWMNYEPENLLF